MAGKPARFIGLCSPQYVSESESFSSSSAEMEDSGRSGLQYEAWSGLRAGGVSKATPLEMWFEAGWWLMTV